MVDSPPPAMAKDYGSIREMLEHSVRADKLGMGSSHAVYALKTSDPGLSGAYALRIPKGLADFPGQLRATTSLTPAHHLIPFYSFGQVILEGQDAGGKPTGIEIIERKPGISLSRWRQEYADRNRNPSAQGSGAAHTQALLDANQHLMTQLMTPEGKESLRHLFHQAAYLGWLGYHRPGDKNILDSHFGNILFSESPLQLNLIDFSEIGTPYPARTTDKSRMQSASNAAFEMMAQFAVILGGAKHADLKKGSPSSTQGKQGQDFCNFVNTLYTEDPLLAALRDGNADKLPEGWRQSKNKAFADVRSIGAVALDQPPAALRLKLEEVRAHLSR